MSMEEISNNTTDDPVTNNEKESESSSSSSSGSSDEESSDEESQMEESEINHAIALATEAVSKTFGWSSNEETKSTSNNNNNNPLSKIIPGYTAPFRLSSSSDTQISDCKKDSIDKLIQNATTNNGSMKRKGVVANKEEVGSKNWFRYASTPVTDELRTDLKILRQRNYINPKKFYKSLDNPSTHVQVGTVIEGVGEYYSSRLSKKERKANFADEIMGDYDTSKYVKQKYRKMSKTKTTKKPFIQRKNRKIKF